MKRADPFRYLNKQNTLCCVRDSQTNVNIINTHSSTGFVLRGRGLQTNNVWNFQIGGEETDSGQEYLTPSCQEDVECTLMYGLLYILVKVFG
jgi:hypothetical protein